MTRPLLACLLNSALFFILIAVFTGCASPGNHITLVDVPSGQIAGVATERGVLVLRKPVIKPNNIYPIVHIFGNGKVEDEAKVIDANEFLALLKPYSTQLNTTRFLVTPMEMEDELFVGILDANQEARYLVAELLDGGSMGDLVICDELKEFPEPSPDGYGGVGLFVYRNDALYLAGILTTMRAEVEGQKGDIYPFVGLEIIYDFLPDLKDNREHQLRPFRPDMIYGVERDGSGE